MSTDEQPTLDAWTPSVDELGGARYRGRDSSSRSDAPADAGQCRSCGRDLPARIQRVVGDNHGRVPGCVECVVPLGPASDEYRTDISAAAAVRSGKAAPEGDK